MLDGCSKHIIPWKAKFDSVCPVPAGTFVALFWEESGPVITKFPESWAWYDDGVFDPIIAYIVYEEVDLE
jgi:hypothetical protein